LQIGARLLIVTLFVAVAVAFKLSVAVTESVNAVVPLPSYVAPLPALVPFRFQA
jgi:hypothetical protein